MIINDNNLVTKSNSLILCPYNLTSEEQKIILTLSSTVQPEDKKFKAYEFKIKDFLKLLNIKDQSKYSGIPKITKSLMKKPFEIREGNKTIQLTWLSSVEYEDGSGKVILCFDPKLKPYLLQLSKFFTSYKLGNVLQLKSKYSIRFYEILKSNQFKKMFIVDIKEFKKILGIESEYTRFYDFKLRVLEQAKKELYSKTDIGFTYEEIREGRRVTSLKFYIFENFLKSKNQMEFTANEKEIDSIDKLKIEMESIIKREVNIEILKNTIKKNNLSIDDIKYYLKNWGSFDYKTKKDPVGFFLYCVINKTPIPKSQNGTGYAYKPEQSRNFDQREYDDDFFESLYENPME
jgi:plasmid replication initiation protein